MTSDSGQKKVYVLYIWGFFSLQHVKQKSLKYLQEYAFW